MWTRRSIAAGVVLTAGLAAWVAHVFPGQAASSPSTQTSQTSQAPPAKSAQGGEPAPADSDDAGGLAPPTQPPAPAQGGSHVTSGGS